VGGVYDREWEHSYQRYEATLPTSVKISRYFVSVCLDVHVNQRENDVSRQIGRQTRLNQPQVAISVPSLPVCFRPVTNKIRAGSARFGDSDYRHCNQLISIIGIYNLNIHLVQVERKVTQWSSENV